jgi:hypothetical protein
MIARLSRDEAQRLGLETPPTRRTTRRVATGGQYHTRCHDCQEDFTTQAAEDRHLVATHHARYDLVLDIVKGTSNDRSQSPAPARHAHEDAPTAP